MESDQELIELANKGDPDAFERLYCRYRDWVYRLAWRFTGNGPDALDVLQETFTYLLGKFPGFELTSSMTTFLYPAVRHISITICSKKNRITSDEDMLNELAAAKSEETKLFRSELVAVLAILPDEQREVLLLRLYSGLRFKAIAETQGVSINTVQGRYRYGLDKLRSFLNSEAEK